MKFNEIYIKNEVYNKELVSSFKKETHNTINTPVSEGSLLDRLRKEKHNILEKVYGNISSFNFKKDVFFSAKWNELSKMARGLFLNNQTGEIIARGYEKFFNYKEDKFNSDNFLKENLVFPVQVYKKYNGFLGILSARNNEFIFHSKSTVEGDYPKYFQNIFEKNHNNNPYDDKCNSLKRFMQDNHICLIFEVIDKDNDPHIIKYEKNEIILLDAVFLEENFKTMNYETLIQIGKDFNFKVKEKEFTFNDYNELMKFIIQEEINMTPQKEGYVIVDNNNYHFKLKCKWYKTWKFMRSLKDKVAKKRQFSTSCLTMPVMNEFIAWCKTQDNDYLLNTDIIKLRDKFYEEYYRK